MLSDCSSIIYKIEFAIATGQSSVSYILREDLIELVTSYLEELKDNNAIVTYEVHKLDSNPEETKYNLTMYKLNIVIHMHPVKQIAES